MLYLAKTVNPFWHDILVILLKLKNKLKVENNTDILAQSIWLNPNIKMDGKMILKGRYIENCIFFINDLMSDNNTLFSYEEFVKTYNINTNFVVYGILSAILPNRWKSMITGNSKLDNIENKLVDKVKKRTKNFL